MATRQRRVELLAGHGLVGQHQGNTHGGALGLVDGHGVTVGQPAGFGVGERHDNCGAVVGGRLEPSSDLVDRRDGAAGAVEDALAVVVADGEDGVADGVGPDLRAQPRAR